MVVVGTAGCLLGPDYQRPVVDAPKNFRFEDAEAKAAANTAWWEQFKDPVLNELILTALQENKDVKIAAARVENFVGQFRTTRAALFPQVNLGANATGNRVSEIAGPTPQLEAIQGRNARFDDFAGFVGMGWELDLWGKLRRATEAARANLLSTEEARRAVILTLVTSVATAYVNLRDLDQQLEVTQQVSQSYLAGYEIMKARYEGGAVSILEVSQTKSQYEQATANIPLFQKSIAQQENALSVLLGRNPGPIPRGKTIDELALPAVPAGVPSQILENRPDIRQAEQNLVSANANIGVAKALYFPSISLTGSVGTESSDLSRLFSGPARLWTYGGTLTLPIFTAGAIAGQVKSAESFEQENVVRYQQAIQTAFREVDDALVDQRRTREQLVSLRQQIAALHDYVDAALLRYEGGYSTYLEVVFAQNQLYAAQLQYVDTQGVLFQALVNVYKAMGGGWVTEADRATGTMSEAPPASPAPAAAAR
jgi:multidrug efflux system outer membrane protein